MVDCCLRRLRALHFAAPGEASFLARPRERQYAASGEALARATRCISLPRVAARIYSAPLARVLHRTLHITFRAGEPKMTLHQALQNAARGAGANNKPPHHMNSEDQKVQNKSTINCLVYYYNTTKCSPTNTTKFIITTNRTNTTNCISPIGVHSISTILP